MDIDMRWNVPCGAPKLLACFMYLSTAAYVCANPNDDFENATAAYNRGQYETAYRLFAGLAEESVPIGQYMLGLMHGNGEGVQKNESQAAYWYRKAGEQGYAPAQNNLGAMYDNPQGMPMDKAHAVHWYRKAALQDYALAQANLGAMYTLGQGVPQDHAQALYWFRKAAEQGNPRGQYNLGIMFAGGNGVSRDNSAAAYWYRKAAEQGYADAQNNLGTLYNHGLGVAQDNARALMWLYLAAAQGYELAQSNSQKVEAGSTPEQIAEAQRLSREFRPEIEEQSQETTQTQEFVVEQTEAPEEYASSGLAGQETEDASNTHQQEVLDAAHPGWLNVVVSAEFLNWFEAQPLALRELYESEYAEDAIYLLDKYTEYQSVIAVQKELAILGYDPGPLDGALGDKTISAIKAFQQDAGLTPDGAPTYLLLGQLRLAQSLMNQHSREPQLEGSGSGFVVSGEGHVLTNQHVIEDCREIRISPLEQAVKVVGSDKRNDLALLQGTPTPTFVRFRSGRGVRVGDDVVVAGFPLRDILSSRVSVTTGTVSAMAGLGNDINLLQITAPVQPGNSGGPLLDEAGNVVGVVVAKLDAIKVAEATGDIPQNVNFAIKENIALNLLDAYGVNYETSEPERLSNAEIADKARTFTVAVECWK